MISTQPTKCNKCKKTIHQFDGYNVIKGENYCLKCSKSINIKYDGVKEIKNYIFTCTGIIIFFIVSLVMAFLFYYGLYKGNSVLSLLSAVICIGLLIYDFKQILGLKQDDTR